MSNPQLCPPCAFVWGALYHLLHFTIPVRDCSTKENCATINSHVDGIQILVQKNRIQLKDTRYGFITFQTHNKYTHALKSTTHGFYCVRIRDRISGGKEYSIEIEREREREEERNNSERSGTKRDRTRQNPESLQQTNKNMGECEWQNQMQWTKQHKMNISDDKKKWISYSAIVFVCVCMCATESIKEWQNKIIYFLLFAACLPGFRSPFFLRIHFSLLCLWL